MEKEIRDKKMNQFKREVRSILLTVFSALVVSYLINRTGWVILFTCFCSLVMVKGIKNKRFLIVSTLLIIIGGWLLISCTDILNSEMINLYNARNEEQGLEARSSRWIEHISNLMIHPFGWAEYGEVYYIHNMWLDIARISGLFPFILLSGLSLHFLIMSFRNTLKYRTDSWMLIFGINICFFASCFVEPIFGGTHFMVYCLLWGCQSTLDWKFKQKYVKSAK